MSKLIMPKMIMLLRISCIKKNVPIANAMLMSFLLLMLFFIVLLMRKKKLADSADIYLLIKSIYCRK